jgi:hypothetical protein
MKDSDWERGRDWPFPLLPARGTAVGIHDGATLRMLSWEREPIDWEPFYCDQCGSWVNDQWVRFWDAVALWAGLWALHDPLEWGWPRVFPPPPSSPTT